MITHKKAQTCRDGLINKLYPKYNSITTNYHGRLNRIPSKKEVVDSWWLSLEFFKKREHWHQEAATWYLNHIREMEAKADKHLDLANIAHANSSHYLDLIGMITLKHMQGVNHGY